MRVPGILVAVVACTFAIAIAIAGCSSSPQASTSLATASPPVAASAADGGCPEGYDLLSIAWLLTQGPYKVPGQLDDPVATSSYKPGNGDGYVCGEIKPRASGASGPITYDFREDPTPVSSPPS